MTGSKSTPFGSASKRLIDDQGFPPGVLLTPNARAWTEAEVNDWLASRPVARKPTTNTAARSDSSQGRAA
ncbi:MAG: helix-turn-helix transcriptional regulator [Roseiarcus sp.]